MNSNIYVLSYDNGTSGASAGSVDLVEWDVRLVSKLKIRTHWLLDVRDNLAYLDALLKKAGGPENVIVAYEQNRKNKRFGTRNNFVNGRNEEFWRVVLTERNLTFASVDPKSWQSVLFKDIPSGDPKDRAREYIRRRCPETGWLDSYNKAPREAIVDAMCIGMWCRDMYRELTSKGIKAGYYEFSGSSWSFPPEVVASP